MRHVVVIILFAVAMVLQAQAQTASQMVVAQSATKTAEYELQYNPKFVLGESENVFTDGSNSTSFSVDERVVMKIKQAAPAVAPGDVNADGDVNIADVMAIYNVMAKKDSNPTADVNADGDVNIADVMAVYNIMAGKGAPSTTKYYYYAGWECPTNEAELVNLIKNANGTNAIGGEADMSKSTIVDFTGNDTYHDEAQYYIVIPTGCKIRNAIETDVTTTFFNNKGTIGNHTIYQRKAVSDMIQDFHITKS